MAKFYIVGAGPGDPELLTVKAAKIISKADVLLYDRLVGEEILKLAPESSEKVYVGKGNGEQEKGQAKIFEHFVRISNKDLKVVRLKGGDPMVFGRGIEEWLFIHELGCEVEFVAGISSALSVPALLGVPLTARGASQGFAIVTGHGLKGSEIDWRKYSSVDTLTILMAVSRRKEIAKQLIANGRNPAELVCFIQNGSTKKQKIITGTLKEVADGLTEVASPAVWVFGNVVSFHHKLFGKESKLENFSKGTPQLRIEENSI